MNSKSHFLQFLMDDEIYPTEKIESPEKKKTETTGEAPLNFSGNKSPETLILIFHQNNDHISSKERKLLENILSAVNQKMDDTAILNLFLNPEFNAGEIILKLNPKHLLCFGLPAQYREGHETDKILEINKIPTFFCKDSLTELSMNKNSKMLLWHALQKIFHINS